MNFFKLIFGHTLQHVNFPRPGMEPMLPALEAQSLNRWTTREILLNEFITNSVDLNTHIRLTQTSELIHAHIF